MKLNPEIEVIDTIAKLILTAARTAPKTKGQDEIVTGIIEDIETLATEMEAVASRGESFKFFKRDADNIRKSDCVLLIGLQFKTPPGINCNGCGYDCATILKQSAVEGDYKGPVCSLRTIDLGIAVGAAAAAAKDLCVDNRVMYSVGVAARRLHLMEAQIILGMPLSITGKNIFFDRTH